MTHEVERTIMSSCGTAARCLDTGMPASVYQGWTVGNHAEASAMRDEEWLRKAENSANTRRGSAAHGGSRA